MLDPLSRGWRCAVPFFLGFLALWAPVGFVGCGSNQVQPPEISPTEVAAQAIKQYDKNGDGLLDADELENCPGLKSQLKALDANKDGKLSADEIADRLTKMVERKIGRLSFSLQVWLDDQPLEGATVRMVPEKFMGDNFQPAVGTTSKDGVANMKLEGSEQYGVQWGYYRIEVSKKDSDGRELPARYNTNTTLGCEASTLIRGSVVFNLTS